MEARPRLLDQVREKLRTLQYSYRTEQQYHFWVRRFILFHGKRHPADMASAEVEAFLSHLAVDRQVSASTQNQALVAPLRQHLRTVRARHEVAVRNGFAGVVSHVPAQLRHAPARARLRHPHGSGTAGAQGR